MRSVSYIGHVQKILSCLRKNRSKLKEITEISNKVNLNVEVRSEFVVAMCNSTKNIRRRGGTSFNHS